MRGMLAPRKNAGTLLGLVGLLVAIVLAACSLTTDVSGLTGGTQAIVTLYSIGGTVTGLENTTITLSRNASDFVTLEGDGPFTFKQRLMTGESYIVQVVKTADDRKCTIAEGEGHVDATDVTNVTVQCSSSNAKLTGLTVSTGPLTPPFTQNTLMYTATPLALDVFAPETPILVTATVAITGATLTINGAPAKSGQPTPVSGLREGANAVVIVVKSPDGVKQTTYNVAVVATVQEAYVKASNTFNGASFGSALAMSADGNTLAVGSDGESSGAKGINGNQNNLGASLSGAVYVFRRAGSVWTQEAYIKQSNTRETSDFGTRLSLSADGNVLAVGATNESSAATGINGDQNSTGATAAGAVYVFRRTPGTTIWAQEAYVKASNTRVGAMFGNVALSGDGTILAVGSPNESSGAKGVDGDQNDTSAGASGAVYIFRRANSVWGQQAYLKASNTRGSANFGWSVALSADGLVLAVGSPSESSASSGVNGDEESTTQPGSGAVYIFGRSGIVWEQNTYVKAGKSHGNNAFGTTVSLAADGRTLAVGAPYESSAASGVNGNQDDTTLRSAGAAYVFSKILMPWTQTAYIKASNPHADDIFGEAVALSGDGRRLVVGSRGESSGATGFDGDQLGVSASGAGAAYAYALPGAPGTTVWSQKGYIKPSNTRTGSGFGSRVAVSGDGMTVAAGAIAENSTAKGINSNQGGDVTGTGAGAVYVFR